MGCTWTWMNLQFQKWLRFVYRPLFSADLVMVHWGWCCPIERVKPVESLIVVLASDRQWCRCVPNSGPNHTFWRPCPVPCTNDYKSSQISNCLPLAILAIKIDHALFGSRDCIYHSSHHPDHLDTSLAPPLKNILLSCCYICNYTASLKCFGVW